MLIGGVSLIALTNKKMIKAEVTLNIDDQMNMTAVTTIPAVIKEHVDHITLRVSRHSLLKSLENLSRSDVELCDIGGNFSFKLNLDDYHNQSLEYARRYGVSTNNHSQFISRLKHEIGKKRTRLAAT